MNDFRSLMNNIGLIFIRQRNSEHIGLQGQTISETLYTKLEPSTNVTMIRKTYLTGDEFS